MNRVIKFRSWDDENKKMYHFNFEDIYQEGEMTSVHACASWSLFDMPHMQFTGLTDKNSQPIFEGDIVKFGDNKIHENTHGKVIFANFRAQFVYEFIDGKYKGKCTDMHDNWRSYEVIGNIFQNPELLEKENAND